MTFIKKIPFKRVFSFAAAIYVAAFMILAGAYSVNNNPNLATVSRPTMSRSLANDGVLDSVLQVFTAVGEWISTTVPTFYSLFYTVESGLTFLGVLAVASIAFAVVFLMIGIVQKFLSFRG